MKYLIVYEQGETNWSAYSPDVPGVGVTGATYEETQQLIHEGLMYHLEWLREDGVPIPLPSHDRVTEFFEVAA